MVGQGKVKMAEAGTVKGHHSPAEHSTQVLHQRKKMPMSPFTMAIGGFAATFLIAYTVLYSKKKPEASAMDVARVVSGTASPQHTRPNN